MADSPSRPSVSHCLNEHRTFPPPPQLAKKAAVKSTDEYQSLYERSLNDAEAFWLEQAQTLDWFHHPSTACRYLWDSAARHIQHTWFGDGKINASYNCVDRYLPTLKSKIAILWQGDEEEDVRKISYGELHRDLCRFANVLQSLGVSKGDRVCIYLPTIPEAAVAMLACARLGAIHSVVFAGFSPESLAHRIQDASCKLVITANVSFRGGRTLHLKNTVDEALQKCSSVEKVIVVNRHKHTSCSMVPNRDIWYEQAIEAASEDCPPTILNAEDPLFILYTSGSTGKPKGVVHTQAGYLLHASLTHKYVFDLQNEDIYWCTADVGWVTGHSYVIYGPLANGATTLLFEGMPTYPDPSRFWKIVDKFKVSIFYTAPTAIRALISKGDEWPSKCDLSSLRILGTVGEPINPEAWIWYYENIGKNKCPVVDTWWQTETGGIMISALPGCHTLKPGSASRPFFGIEPVIVREDGSTCNRDEGGALCIRRPWPGMMRTMWGDHQRFIDTYFSTYKDLYFTGDGCRIDLDGDYWLLGRIDDVVNVSGHRIGTAEVESALVSHPQIAEAAVVPVPHAIKGQGLAAYVIMIAGSKADKALKKQLMDHVKKEIGSIAVPEEIRFVNTLPKTRSGKIMRRLLRKIAANEIDDLGDISTLADLTSLKELMQEDRE